MNHFTTPDYWKTYQSLPDEIRLLADKQFQILKSNARHPSLHFKRIGDLYSVRVGLNYRALGVPTPDKDGVIWFWIGNHRDYEDLIK